MLDDRFVYFPTAWEDQDWHELSQLPLEETWFRAEDGTRLFGWYLEPLNAEAVLLWCHGNAGSIIHRLDHLSRFYSHGLACFLWDYRGYGRSEGSPSEEGLYLDVQAAYDHLASAKGVTAGRLIGYGQSLGAAVVAELALRRKVAGLILEAPFPSVAAVARRHYGGVPVDLLLRARYDLTGRLRRVQAPVLVLHGDQDSIIPMEMGRAVYDAANEPKEFYRVPGADHNDLYLVGGDDYFARFLHFARQAT